jgi:hypothetical protein
VRFKHTLAAETETNFPENPKLIMQKPTADVREKQGALNSAG